MVPGGTKRANRLVASQIPTAQSFLEPCVQIGLPHSLHTETTIPLLRKVPYKLLF